MSELERVLQELESATAIVAAPAKDLAPHGKPWTGGNGRSRSYPG